MEATYNASRKQGKTKLNIMRKLAGTTWGANGKILKQVYQSTVRPHLEYGASAWMTATKSHQQTLEKVQNQALRIMSGSMRSTPITKMEQATGLPPLKTRWNSKAMVQHAKIKALEDHPMHEREKKLEVCRLKRSNFLREAKELYNTHNDKLPENKESLQVTSDQPPWENGSCNIEVCCTVPQLHCKDDLSDEIKRSLTLELLEEKYPQEAWTQVYTDGSATDATKNGGVGVYVRTPDGNTYSESLLTGKNCTNYRAEVEALILAANMLRDTTYE